MWERWFEGRHIDFSEEMQAILVCEKMGWTWYEYQEQPSFFIRMIIEKMVGESLAVKKQKSSK